MLRAVAQAELGMVKAHRPLATSASCGAIPRKDDRRGSRITRITRRSVTPSRSKEVSPIVPPSHRVEATPPWPTTSTSGRLPWNAYNQGPTDVTATASPPEAESSSTISRIPVIIPTDVDGVLDNSVGESAHRARDLLAVQAIVVVRQLEMMNLFLGYEEANKYQLLSPDGTLLGYLMEEDLGFRSAMTRQVLRTHRAFKATVLDTQGNVLLRIQRPFSWINSRIYVSVPGEMPGDESVIGEAQQEWHLYRRKYNHFVKRGDEMVQFASTDSGFLAWDFFVRNERGETIGSINRNFAGFGRELFTDTGQYVLRFEGVVDELAHPAIEPPPTLRTLPTPSTSLRMEPASGFNKGALLSPSHSTPPSAADSTALPSTLSSVPATVPLPSITLDQRAVMLASAVSIDFDYFTRSRGGFGSSGMWVPMPSGGGGTTAEAGAEVPEPGTGAESGAIGSTDSDSPASEYNDDGVSIEDGGEWSPGDVNRDSGGWNDEVMKDPWADPNPGTNEDGGTWSWGDLFPGDE